MTKRNRTTLYLFPLLKMKSTDYEMLKAFGFKNMYIGDEINKGMGELYIVVDNKDIDSTFLLVDNMLKSNTLYKDSYLKKDSVIYVFQLKDVEDMYVYTAFIRSRFSKMKDYTIKHKFPEKNADGSLNELHYIHFKKTVYKKMLEDKLGVTIDEDMELGEKLKNKEEIYEYKGNH